VVAVPEVVVRRKLTFDDYCALPDDQDYEIIEGVLYVSPRARAAHQRIAGKLTQLLLAQEDLGRGVVVPDADLIVDAHRTYVSPDVMFFAGDRFASVNPRDFIRVIPDLVVEVLSPSMRDYDLTKKLDTYARLGVRHYWVADGERRAMLEHVLQEDGTYRVATTRVPEAFRPELFEGTEINLARIFV